MLLLIIIVAPFCVLIRYVWYRNGVEVQSSTGLGISLDAKTGVLKINPFTVDREGVFQCRAKNTFPERMQPVAVSSKIEARVAREYWITALTQLAFSKLALLKR